MKIDFHPPLLHIVRSREIEHTILLKWRYQSTAERCLEEPCQAIYVEQLEIFLERKLGERVATHENDNDSNWIEAASYSIISPLFIR